MKLPLTFTMLFPYLLLLLVVHQIARCITLEFNNVCKTFPGYYFPYFNQQCYYDPDLTLSTSKLIGKYAPNEVHQVTSEDGYILQMFRIPRKNPKGVILFHHSIATYSRIYLWQSNNSLAITLWHLGFDVWLANQRGTTYSDRHVNMSKHDYSYWNFGFQEMGVYDVSSELKYIRSKTNGAQVIYIGHSLGSTVGTVYAAMKPQEAETYLKTMVLIAAPAYFQYGTSVVFKINQFTPLLQSVVQVVHSGSPLGWLYPNLVPITRIALRLLPFILSIGKVVIWAFCGYTPNETDPTFFNYDVVINGNNFSWKTLIHYGQLTNTNGRFQLFDYGKKKNLEVYGQEIPPLYPLENITVPILLISSYNDSLISEKDSEHFYNQLDPKVKTHGHWKLTGLNHLDYLVGRNRRKIFADRLVKFLVNL